jgi:uncharacterized protein (TIGR03067 family)
MRRIIPTLLVVWLLPVLACGGLKINTPSTASNNQNASSKDSSTTTNNPTPGNPVAPDSTTIQGSWVPTTGESQGNKVPDQVLRGIKWTINGTKITYEDAGAKDQGTFTVNPNATPKTFDFVSRFGTMNGIYELSGDTLKVCYGLGQRPATFSTQGVKFGVYYVMKRVSK